MKPGSPVRTFGPLAAIAAIQLVIVLAFPSTAPTTSTAADTSTISGAPGVGALPNGSLPSPGASAGTASGPAANGGGSGTVTPGAGGAVVPGGGGAPPATANGDRTHCIDGRQFSPALEYFAPPCVAGVPGAAYPGNNGGATWQGVTKDTIEIVNYVPDYGAEVNTILKAQGLYYSAPQAKVFNAAFERFINGHYQLYGRRLHIDTFQGTCQTVPPNLQCLIPEMQAMVAKYHPYAVVFQTTLCSACYAELARLKVVSTGGAGFSDAFHNANAPYSYDVAMSSTRIELEFAEFWCNQMTSLGGSGRTAIFAGTQNKQQDFRQKPRVLGILSTNDPDNKDTVKNVLYPALKRGCGEVVTHEYFYAQDINRAAQQSQAGSAALNTAKNPATSVLCLCDPVAPQFASNAGATQNYWPESLISSNQSMDVDATAQTYMDSNGQASLACPSPSKGCNYENTVGIGQADAEFPEAQMSAVKIFKQSSQGAGQPVKSPSLQIFWDNYNMLASLIQNTGPTLTPARMQQLAPNLGSRGGGTTGRQRRAFEPGSWTWVKDVRVLYLNKHKKSVYNGQPGAYVQIEGRRLGLGEFPKLKQPPAPLTADRR